MSKTALAAKPQGSEKPANTRPAVQPGTALATGERARSVLYDMADRFGMEPAAFEATLRHTVIPKDCSREQFAAFLLVAKEYNLNPLLKEIYAFPAKGGGIQPIVGVDGWSNLINSHPAFDGMEFDDKLDGQGNIVAITCRMFRKDRSHAISATEYMAECKRPTEPWTKWPRRMLRHKAMIQGARYAFGFAGIVDPDEAERFAAEAARDVTPNRVASTAAAFDEFSRSPAIVDQTAGADATEHEAGDLGDPPREDPADFGSEFADDQPQGEAQKPAGEQPKPSESKAPAKADEPQKEADNPAEQPKQEATATAWPLDKEPTTVAEYLEYVKAKVKTFTDPSAISAWFKGPEERKLRNTNKCNVPEEIWKQCVTVCQERVAELKSKAN